MIDEYARQALRALLGDRVEFDAALSRHTSLRQVEPYIYKGN